MSSLVSHADGALSPTPVVAASSVSRFQAPRLASRRGALHGRVPSLVRPGLGVLIVLAMAIAVGAPIGTVGTIPIIGSIFAIGSIFHNPKRITPISAIAVGGAITVFGLVAKFVAIRGVAAIVAVGVAIAITIGSEAGPAIAIGSVTIASIVAIIVGILGVFPVPSIGILGVFPIPAAISIAVGESHRASGRGDLREWPSARPDAHLSLLARGGGRVVDSVVDLFHSH